MQMIIIVMAIPKKYPIEELSLTTGNIRKSMESRTSRTRWMKRKYGTTSPNLLQSPLDDRLSQSVRND